MPKLTARKVETAKKPGDYGDGEGLILRVGPTGAKSWVLRTVVHGKRKSFGLGSTSYLTLAEAREKARSLRKVAREGGDPNTLRRKETLTFWEAAERVHENLRPTWKNKKHSDTWLQTVRTHAKPRFGDRPIESVGTSDILEVLTPIWHEKNETAKRLRQRLATIFDWAKGSGHYPHENPVNGVKKALPNVKRKVVHMPSLPWKELPAFMHDLSSRTGTSARALEMIVLTGLRSWEARGARWEEFDLSTGTWTIPASRMKGGIAHRVPLTPQSIAVLEQVRGLDSVFAFPSPSRAKDGSNRPLSDAAFDSLYERMDVVGISTHGFRSTFRDWASEYAHADRVVAEACLAHALGNEVERAYARSDHFERRKALMESWSRFAVGAESGQVRKLA